MVKILIIEDDPSFRLILTGMMRKAGLDATFAANGLEGIELFGRERFDLVITDIIMPIMEGIETIIELRKMAPRIKIIAMSAGGQIEPEKYLSTAKALGVNAVLKKSFSYEELKKVLMNLDVPAVQ